MTGDVTSLEVSRRLAKVWPSDGNVQQWWCRHKDRPDRQLWSEPNIPSCIAAAINAGKGYPARTLSELETETRRMGLLIWELCEWSQQFPRWPRPIGQYFIALVRDGSGKWAKESCSAHGETIIDAWGNALAEAKEKL